MQNKSHSATSQDLRFGKIQEGLLVAEDPMAIKTEGPRTIRAVMGWHTPLISENPSDQQAAMIDDWPPFGKRIYFFVYAARCAKW